MFPELDLGPLTLQTFGISFALGFLASGALIARRLKEISKPPDWAYEIAFAALVGGLVGARLNYIVGNYDSADGLFGNLFSGSGLVWYGGLLGGAIGVLLWAHRRGFLERRLLDLCAPSLALGNAIGRVGCQLSGDGDYGRASDLPWAMAYPEGTVSTLEQVHPTPVYETVALGLSALLLWSLRDRVRPGALFALYLVLSGTERLLVEFVRRNEDVLVGLTQAQLISAVMIAGGLAWLMRMPGGPLKPAPAASPRPASA
ncbi:MAG: prolipoprotein diacylglyceryl transferase [Thermoleophilaceae bacterium]